MTMKITQVRGSEKTHITEWWKIIRIKLSSNKKRQRLSRTLNNRKINHDGQEEDQVHKYVHG
eukprot:12646875-Heterocapsa_arctica.AAC.1